MRVTIQEIKEMKQGQEKITMLTAYDYGTAKLVDEVGIPLILVGDSLGMVILGYESTIPVTMEEMIHHTKAVVRGTKRALIVGDMPFMTYHMSVSDALSYWQALEVLAGPGTKVHLTGGEPFGNWPGLMAILRAAHVEGLHAHEVETNAFWCTRRQDVQ